jgi:hypothetical protein
MGPNLIFGVGISAAAKDAKVSRWTMRRRLRALDRCFPELNLLAHTPGTKRAVGKYHVNPRAMVECRSLLGAKESRNELTQRVDMHEGIFRGLKIRLKRLDKRLKRLEATG